MQSKKTKENSFKNWLAQKHFSYETFSQKTGIGYNTIVKWTRGSKPRNTSKILIKRVFPDCPLILEEPLTK